jgi:hypothetical protein
LTSFRGVNAVGDQLTLTGTLITLYVDHALDEGHDHIHNDDIRYYLRTTQGKAFRLQFKNPPRQAEAISKINIQGKLLINDEIEVLDYKEDLSTNITNLAKVQVASARSNQRTLVVPINNLRSSIGFLYQGQKLHDLVFSNTQLSLNTYFSEVSGSRINFSGEVAPVLNLSGNLCAERELFAGNGWLDVLNIIYRNYDLTQFDRLSIIVPNDPLCLGAGAIGVGSLGKVEFETNQGKIFQLSFNFVRSYTEPIGNDATFLSVLAHEFGHNLGLRHDNGNSCGKQIFSRTCPSIEYGGAHSIMGYASSLAHLNSIHKEKLRWLDSSDLITIRDSRHDAEYTLAAVASKSQLPKAIKLMRNDGSFYVIEYRQPINMESHNAFVHPANYDGFLVYLNNNKLNNDSILLRSDLVDLRRQLGPVKYGSYHSFNQAKEFSVLAPFESGFVDPINKIQVIPVTRNSETITVRIIKGNSVVIHQEDTGNPVDQPSYEPSVDDWKQGQIFALTNMFEGYYTNREMSFYLNFPAHVLESLKHRNLIKSVEWDFDDGNTTITESPNDISYIHTFREEGVYNIRAKINLLTGESFVYERNNFLVKEFFSIEASAVGNKANINSELSLNYDDETSLRLRLRINRPSSFLKKYRFQLLMPSNLSNHVQRQRGSRRINLKRKEISFLYRFASEEELRPFLLEYLMDDGYYEIPIAMLQIKKSSKTPSPNYAYLRIKASK